MLTLLEDQTHIQQHFEQYLHSTKVVSWKFEEALKKLFVADFQSTDVSDLNQLGSIYKSLLERLYSTNRDSYTDSEQFKIRNVIEHMDQICSAGPIKRLFKEHVYKSNYRQSLEDEVLVSSHEEFLTAKKKKGERNFSKLSVEAKFAHLATYYGDNGILDLQRLSLPKRFRNRIGKMKAEIGVLLQPIVTLEERDMLVKIASCKNFIELKAILPVWYAQCNMSANCRYIRFALATSLELWSSNAMLNKGHREDWYRMHLYAHVWDKAFFDDVEFETKRSKCVSQATKVLKETDKDVKLKRLDFILRDLNNNNDVITVEEKPSSKGVKADIRKGDLLKKNSLYLWSKQVNSDTLIGQLESISCQWQGTKFSIYGSRLVSPDKIITYKKGEFSLPTSGRHASELGRLLMAVISLKRVAKHNYAKFILILEEKYKREVETLNFDNAGLNETSFLSDSTDSTGSDSECKKYQDQNEEEFVETVMAKIKKLKFEEANLKQYEDWEDLLMFDSVKRRKLN
ncbi:hypothetical protein INT47_012184 [Mucor saturninus]|uniref:Uncharacterized protein n=1 Tax=Mucor saturninus TaxID=64648 RepID=A0A8H7V316_9FUNG|nr:hypothetical protein INT47_012184 [Mucor saturninus]